LEAFLFFWVGGPGKKKKGKKGKKPQKKKNFFFFQKGGFFAFFKKICLVLKSTLSQSDIRPMAERLNFENTSGLQSDLQF